MTMRRAGLVRRSIAIALLLLLLPVGAVVEVDAQTPRTTELRDVSVTTQPDSVTIVVKTTGEVKYQAELVDQPYRLVLDFEDTSYGWRKTPLAVEAEPLKQIRGSQYRRGVARVVVELTRKVGYAIREESDGLAIVIPTATSARLAEPVAMPSPKPAPKPAATKPAAPAAAPRRRPRRPRPSRPNRSASRRRQPRRRRPRPSRHRRRRRRRPPTVPGSSRSISRTPTSSTSSAFSPPRARATSSSART